MGAIMKEQNLNDWKEVKLQDICIKMQSGGTPKADNKKYYGGDIPFTKIDDITKSGKYLISTSNTITEDGLKNSSAWKVPKNSILYSMYASLGFLSINKIEVATNQAILNIIPNEKLCQLEYLYYALLDYKKEINKYVSQSTQKNLNAQKVRNFKLNLPPLQEQEKIAEILSNIDDQIEKTQEIITKTEEIKQGLMQELLIKGIGHKEFKEVNILATKYKIPNHWELVEMDSILDLLTDFEANGSFADVKDNVNVYDEKNYAWYVRATDLENNSSLDKVKYVDESSYEFLRKTKLYGGEVLITKRGEIGKVYLVPKLNIPMTVAPNTYLLKLKKDINSKYVFYFFKSIYGQKELIGIDRSTTIGAIYKDDVKYLLKITLSPLQEQEQIANILSNVDINITKEKNYLNELQETKKGLMQDLLSGKVRVN